MPAPNDKRPIKRILFFVKLVEVRLRFVAILVVTALVVGYWDTITNYWERFQRNRGGPAAVAAHDHASEFEFFCPMHPFVIRERPGKCPICGMDLVKRPRGAAAELPEGTLARVQAAPNRMMQAGVQVEPIVYRLLMHGLRSYGVVAPDEARISRIIARFPGRIDELLVNTVGQEVREGEAVARIYSPRYLAAAQEYVQALESAQRMKSSAGSPERVRRAEQIAEFARRRLELAGFTPDQLDAIARQRTPPNTVTLYSPLSGTVLEKKVLLGDMVEEGTELYIVADLSTVWIQVKPAESDLASIKTGMPVEVTAVSFPDIFRGTVDFIYPTVNEENRTNTVRIVVSNQGGKLKPGMYVRVRMQSSVAAPDGAAPVQAKAPSASKSATRAEATTATTPKDRASSTTGKDEYICTMCPDVHSDKPGDCPNCGMKLVKKSEVQSLAPTPGAGDQATSGSAKVQYTCPMHPEVISDTPGKCPKCGMDLVKKETPAESTLPDGGSMERFAEGWACPIHPETLQDRPGKCPIDGMEMTRQRLERVLSVRETAVIDTGARQIVYVESMPGVYDAREVQLGARSGAYYPVLEGLALGDRVVTRGSFLIDAEARLDPTNSRMYGSKSGESADKGPESAEKGQAPAAAGASGQTSSAPPHSH
jgi:multidrug efflux pump subunit AcrA (membrane-fusion protein)